MARGTDTTPGGAERWHVRHADRLCVFGLMVGFFALYLATLCPTVYWYDSAEYAGAAATLGIPHAPGYPLYTLLAALFALLPFEPAYSVNLMSAVFGSVAVGLAFVVSRRLGLGRPAAFLGAATLGAGKLFWSQSVIAEVYTPTAAILLLVLWLLWRGLSRDRAWPLFAAAFVAGLGLGVHLSIATWGLGLVLLVWGIGARVERLRELRSLVSRAGLRRRCLVALGCALAAALGACIYFYLPLRAAMNPPLMVVDTSHWERFLWLVTGGNFDGWFMHNYDRWARAELVGGILYDQLLMVGTFLAPLGLYYWVRRLPLFGVALVLAAGGNLWFFFNYGVHDVEVFFTPAVVVLALWTGAGAQLVFEALARVPSPNTARLRRVVPAVLAVLFPLSLVAANYRVNDLSRDTSARDFGERACQMLPQNAVVLTFTNPAEWRKDAVFAKYFQLVLHRRPDVKVLEHFSVQDAVAMFQRGEPVYLYEPVRRALAVFALRPEGDFFRAVALRGRPVLGPVMR